MNLSVLEPQRPYEKVSGGGVAQQPPFPCPLLVASSPAGTVPHPDEPGCSFGILHHAAREIRVSLFFFFFFSSFFFFSFLPWLSVPAGGSD